MFLGVKFHYNLRALYQPFLFGRCLVIEEDLCATAKHLELLNKSRLPQTVYRQRLEPKNYDIYKRFSLRTIANLYGA
jgi:hypothetical protein